MEQILAFCQYYGICFYKMGCPENWDDPTCFRAGDNGFPQRGITIALDTVKEWVEHPPFLAEGI